MPTRVGVSSRAVSGHALRPRYGCSVVQPGTERSLRGLAKFLVGPAEIAERLGVEANTINVWKARHPNFRSQYAA